MAADAYQEYLQRFQANVGALAVGAYGKWKGKLVRKLAPNEFATKREELETLQSHYKKALERGDTINDAVLKLVRERQAELLLEE